MNFPLQPESSSSGAMEGGGAPFNPMSAEKVLALKTMKSV